MKSPTNLFMAKVYITIVIGLSSVIFSCKKDKAIECNNTVEYKIVQTLNAPPKDPRTELWEWEYEGKKYTYVSLPAVCCDTYSSELYDGQCTLICYPSGGFSGEGDGKCEAIKAGAVKKLVWKDSR